MFRLPSLLFLTAALAACDVPFEEELIIVEPVMEEAAFPVSTAPPPPPPSSAMSAKSAGTPRRGVITAGDIDDTLNLAAFQRYAARTAKSLQVPQTALSRPVRLQLTGTDGAPAPGTFVTLRKPGTAQTFWSGYAGIDGMITVFPNLHGVGRLAEVELRAVPETGPEQRHLVKTSGPRQQIKVASKTGWTPDFLDLAIVLDTTSSMDDEIAWIIKELRGVVSSARRASPGIDIRYGLVTYNAPGDPVPVRSYGFTKSIGKMQGWLKGINADGGYGGDEVVARGLEAGVALKWRRGKGERILLQIGDEPPARSRSRAYLAAAREAAQKGIHIYGLGASGVEEHLEYLMRSGAAMTQGRYLFLTDDSGVGLAHGEPAIACYRVTALTNLMKRILVSELTGRRVEAKERDVVRTVGAYRNGRCLGSS